jgi:hypothetical protein
MGYLQEARENHVKKKVEEGDSRTIPHQCFIAFFSFVGLGVLERAELLLILSARLINWLQG